MGVCKNLVLLAISLKKKIVCLKDKLKIRHQRGRVIFPSLQCGPILIMGEGLATIRHPSCTSISLQPCSFYWKSERKIECVLVTVLLVNPVEVAWTAGRDLQDFPDVSGPGQGGLRRSVCLPDPCYRENVRLQKTGEKADKKAQRRVNGA